MLIKTWGESLQIASCCVRNLIDTPNRSVNLAPFCKQPASINGCSNQPLLGKTFFAASSTFSGPHLKHPTKPKGFMGFSGIYRRFAKFTNEKHRETKVLKSCSNKNWPSKNLWPFPSCNLKGGYLERAQRCSFTTLQIDGCQKTRKTFRKGWCDGTWGHRDDFNVDF